MDKEMFNRIFITCWTLVLECVTHLVFQFWEVYRAARESIADDKTVPKGS